MGFKSFIDKLKTTKNSINKMKVGDYVKFSKNGAGRLGTIKKINFEDETFLIKALSGTEYTVPAKQTTKNTGRM